MTKPVKKIVAIGGGEIRDSETLAIDKEIIRLTQKKHPKLLFIPTASSDSEDYYNDVDKYFGKKLGCKTNVLYLLKEAPSPKEIRNKILSSDIIYFADLVPVQYVGLNLDTVILCHFTTPKNGNISMSVV